MPVVVVLLLVAAAGAVVGGGCQTEAEATRALARARQDEWTRQMKALGTQEAALRERFGRLPALAADAQARGRARAGRLRAEALLAGSRQSLADLEISVRQAAGRIEAAAAVEGRGQGREGGEGASAVLEREHERVQGVLKMLGEQLGSAEQEIARLGRS
jgi:hypothetical protein